MEYITVIADDLTQNITVQIADANTAEIAANTAKITNATHTGEVTGATALTITPNAVTNAKLATMPTKTYKGRTSALTGVVEDVAVATLKSDLLLVKADVGLGNADNTSDVNKPISNATQTALNLKLNTADYNQHFKGKYLTAVAMRAAHPTASVGDSAQVNEVGATTVVNYSWDDELVDWVITGSVSGGAANTDELPEGSTNFYHTSARVLATVLTGISFLTGTAVVATDSILVAFGKLQKQISDLILSKQNKLTAGTNITIDVTDPANPVINAVVTEISPINYTGTDTEKIQQAVNYASANEVPMIIPKKDAINTPWDIETAILLKSNTTITIDGAILKMTDTSRDNMFRTENCGFGIVAPFTVLENIHIKGLNGAKCSGADNPRASGDAGKTLTAASDASVIKSYGTDAGVSGQTQTGDWRNIMLLFAYTKNYSVSGIYFENGQMWTISNERCSYGKFKRLQFNLIGNRIIAGSTRYVRNNDGIDFRTGCNNMIVDDITGHTDDDTIACTIFSATQEAGIYGTYQVTGDIYGDATDDIYSIDIRNILTSTLNDNVRLLNKIGTKLYNINIDNIENINTSTSSTGAAVIIGTITGTYGENADLGELYGISINNIKNKYKPYSVLINGCISESNISNIIDTSVINANYPIYLNTGNKGTRNVQLSNIFKKSYFNEISAWMDGLTAVRRGTKINVSNGKLQLFDTSRTLDGEVIVKDPASPIDTKYFWSGTQVDYDAIVTKDASTIYIIVG